MIKLVIKKKIEEKRKNPDLNVKTPILKQLEKYSDDSSYYVSFTDLEKIGLNPVNRYSTPIGVYAYNLKDLWTDWIAGDRFFGDDRKYVNLIKLNTDKVLDLANYKNFARDIKKVENIYNERYKSKTGGKSFQEFIRMIEKNADLYRFDDDASKIWGITQAVAELEDKIIGKFTKKSTVDWNKMFRELGYDVIIDKTANIHILQSSQAVFLIPTSYKLVGRLLNKTYGAKKSSEEYWGSEKQPFWRPGANPTVDIVVFKKEEEGYKILLIKRGSKSKTEVGKLALPGGFHDTRQPKGKKWINDRETARQAAFRELTEETGLYIPWLNKEMKLVGEYEGSNRDPRDNEESWSKSTAFAVLLPNEVSSKVEGRDDAESANWYDLKEILSANLAFDHKQIIIDSIKKLNLRLN